MFVFAVSGCDSQEQQVGATEPAETLNELESSEVEQETAVVVAESSEELADSAIETVEAEVRASLAEKERVFIDCWYDEDARERLREAIDKFWAWRGNHERWRAVQIVDDDVRVYTIW